MGYSKFEIRAWAFGKKGRQGKGRLSKMDFLFLLFSHVLKAFGISSAFKHWRLCNFFFFFFFFCLLTLYSIHLSPWRKIREKREERRETTLGRVVSSMKERERERRSFFLLVSFTPMIIVYC
ncbi:hypothetical protein K445DRAFT_288551 [Daldinia sp. EC12]|nr:hypothetical protein K445DRAFT_288551 [Daldinia sp. EC12]